MPLGKRLRTAAILLLLLVALSTAGYRVLGGPSVSFLNALYMSVITVAGVGYGEIVNTAGNPALRVFNIFVVLFGVAVTVYVFSVVAAFLLEMESKNPFWRRGMQKRIDHLSGHSILCGLGDTGRHTVEEIHKAGGAYVVVDCSEENIKRWQELQPDLFGDLLYVVGDATEEEVLDRAGIRQAGGVIACLPHEKDNLVITVLARQRYPKLRVVARANDQKFADRLTRAGASATVSPSRIGGLRMASELMRPHAVNFLDMMLRERSHTLRVEQIEVGEKSAWAGMPLASADLRATFKLLPLALYIPGRASENQFVVDPAYDTPLQAGMIIVAMGDIQDFQRARVAAGSHHPGS